MEAMTTKLLFVLFSLQIPLSFSGQTNSIESVPDLQRLMYNVADGYPCVRLLNLSGEIGCSNPGRDKVVAPIVRFKDAKELGQSSTILVSTEEIQDFFDRVLNNPSFSKNIGGVLVESESGVRNQWKGFSPAQKFPQAEFAPYHRINYDWNPMGSGVLWKAFNFPVFLLSESSTSIIQEIARKQEKTKKSFTADVAEFDVVMETTKAGTHNSPSCLKEQTCLPLGGYRAVFGHRSHQLMFHRQISSSPLYLQSPQWTLHHFSVTKA